MGAIPGCRVGESASGAKADPAIGRKDLEDHENADGTDERCRDELAFHVAKLSVCRLTPELSRAAKRRRLE